MSCQVCVPAERFEKSKTRARKLEVEILERRMEMIGYETARRSGMCSRSKSWLALKAHSRRTFRDSKEQGNKEVFKKSSSRRRTAEKCLGSKT